MPNHIKNIIKVTGSDAEVKKYLDAGEEFSFQNFIPAGASRGEQIDQWGTKRDAYEVTYEEDGYTFNTAWSHPAPVIKKMSEMYPELIFEIKYADEDLGYNMGHYTIKDGSTHYEDLEDGDIGFAVSVREFDGKPFTKDSILDALYVYCYINDDNKPKQLDDLGNVERWIVDKYGLATIYNLKDEVINNFMSILMKDVVINEKLSIFIDKINSNG